MGRLSIPNWQRNGASTRPPGFPAARPRCSLPTAPTRPSCRSSPSASLARPGRAPVSPASSFREASASSRRRGCGASTGRRRRGGLGLACSSSVRSKGGGAGPVLRVVAARSWALHACGTHVEPGTQCPRPPATGGVGSGKCW